jgi:adenosylmethionine-8-amino-7-oxononanoate aminotransferase
MPAVTARGDDTGRPSHQVPKQRETTLWHSQAHMPTVKRAERVIVRGEGAWVFTEDGQRLLDAPATLWHCNVGHGRVEIADAVAAQMRTLETYTTFQEYVNRPAIELAERVADLAPVANAKVFFTSGGSDAVDLAGKLARRYWDVQGFPDKRVIVTRSNGYHGLHALGTSIAGIEPNRLGYGTLVAETERVAMHDAGVLEALVRERGADQIAAFYCEPIIGTGGVYPPAPGYLEAVQRICRESEILFVVDEVITGFGRTGAMFASDRFGLEPDIMLVAKGITSGYMPLGAAVIAERVWEPFWADGSDLIFRHGITYAGHASACAAAMANIDVLEREQLVDRVKSLEPVLDAAFRPLESHALVREVRSGVGLLAGVELHELELLPRVCARCVENGVIARMLSNATIQVSPPFVVEPAEIEQIAAVIGEALDWVAAG